ncbi:MAG: sensor histidine kinase, partial [Bacteroidota bacterium]|nr:sensor histidine kinase [Bacteroidota bacterium]
RHDYSTAYHYLAAAGATRDSLFGQVKIAQLQALAFSEQLHQQELAEQRFSSAAARRQRLLLAGLVALAGAAGLTYLLLNRRRLRREVEFAQERQQLERLRAQAVLDAEEAERRRIGADLHDGVGQLLTAAKLNLHALAEELHSGAPTGAPRLLAHALDVVDESFREVRSISHNLRPNALIRCGLGQAVRDFTSKVSPGGQPRFCLEFVGLDENHRLEPALESVLFRVIQELVQNIVKHAHATEVTVQLRRRPHELCVLVEDNGVGFDPTALSSEGGIGLKNIESRMVYLGGRVKFDSRPGQGTAVTIEVPMPGGVPANPAPGVPLPMPAVDLLARVGRPNPQ